MAAFSSPPAIVFTDLDGTLLDHDTYDWAPVAPMLERLRQLNVPVVLASSKTAAEMRPLSRAMGLNDIPMICENGAGLVQIAEDTSAAPAYYARLRATLDRLDPALRKNFQGFGDLGPEGIAQATGLTPEAARAAARRDFSEPGLWQGTEAQRQAFLKGLSAQGVSARQGGRFLTLSFGSSKADRMDEVRAGFGQPPCGALGDAPNDIDMLAAADFGVIVFNPHGVALSRQPGETEGTIMRTQAAAPEGWVEGVTWLLARLEIED